MIKDIRFKLFSDHLPGFYFNISSRINLVVLTPILISIMQIADTSQLLERNFGHISNFQPEGGISLSTTQWIW
jgi:hypothetical protein